MAAVVSLTKHGQHYTCQQKYVTIAQRTMYIQCKLRSRLRTHPEMATGVT